MTKGMSGRVWWGGRAVQDGRGEERMLGEEWMVSGVAPADSVLWACIM